MKIRERVRSRNNQQRKAAAIEAYQKQYAEELNRIRLYERDGLCRSDSVEDVIDKEYATYAKVTEKYMNHIRPENSEEEKEEEQDPGEVFWDQWAHDMIRDRHTNVLAQLYFSELASVGAKLLEPEEFSETTCGRALLRLLAYTSKGSYLLLGCYEADDGRSRLPTKSDACRAIANNILEEPDPEVFLCRLFSEVPGSHRAIFRLLRKYKSVVRLQCEIDNVDYPDFEESGYEILNPTNKDVPVKTMVSLFGGDQINPFESNIMANLNLERAVLSVLKGELTQREAAETYSLTRWVLQNSIQERTGKKTQRSSQRERRKEKNNVGD